MVVEVDDKARSKGDKAEEKTVYKIDIPANRYDLLCTEGLVRALNVFLGNCPIPTFHYSTPTPREKIIVKAETQIIRPFVVGAVLRNITLNHTRYNSFLDLQDKLHFNICRRRSLVAIGTHDLDSIQGPFTYEALKPESIEFVPLVPATKSFTAKELLEYYRDKKNDDVKHLREYTDLIYHSPVYPLSMTTKDEC